MPSKRFSMLSFMKIAYSLGVIGQIPQAAEK